MKLNILQIIPKDEINYSNTLKINLDKQGCDFFLTTKLSCSGEGKWKKLKLQKKK